MRRPRMRDSEIESLTWWRTNWPTSGSGILLPWIGGMSCGSMKDLQLGWVGLQLTTCIRVSLTVERNQGSRTDCLFQSGRSGASLLYVECREVEAYPADLLTFERRLKLSKQRLNSIRFVHLIQSKFQSATPLKLIRSSTISAILKGAQ